MEDKTIKRITLFIVTLSSFLAPFDISSVNIALPTIGKEMSMTAISLGWVSTAYLLASAMFLVPFGRIADIYGRKKIFISGDHILPEITPNIGVHPQALDNPLGKYMASLQELRQLDVKIVLPGHDKPFWVYRFAIGTSSYPRDPGVFSDADHFICITIKERLAHKVKH